MRDAGTISAGDDECGAPLDAPFDAPVPEKAQHRLVGESGSIGQVRQTLESIADRHCTVVVLGETGTGKEMIARHLHASSRRAGGPFVPVDCSALSDTLFESQMFGHVKGAFTGAVRDSLGFVRTADGGTLFLDEVGELPPTQQAKLLRLLQERHVTPVGESRPIPVDVRVVCATHRNLEAMVDAGDFREDLFFRLAVVTLRVPPLRERPGDVRALAEYFLRQQAYLYDEPVRLLTRAALAAMEVYAWPGNVRELANAMEHAHVMAAGPMIEVLDLPGRILSATGAMPAREIPPPELSLTAMEKRIIAEALRRTDGNKTAACRLLGINIQRLNRRLSKLGLDPQQLSRE